MATNETEKLQETIDELKERIERLEKENAKLKGETGWEPKRNEDYFAIDAGRVWDYANVDQSTTDAAIAAGNCFKTRNEAEEFLEWLKARKTLIDDTKGFKPDLEDNDEERAYVFYIIKSKQFFTAESDGMNDGQSIWFKTEKDAEESIEKHEKEWRIYMGLPAKDDDDDK